MHYYQFNIGDYASHTKGLSLLEDLAYRRLIDEYYLAERPFNGCSTNVARLIGFVEHSDSVAYVLDRFFEQDGDTWIHKRIESDLKRYQNRKKAASKAGKASGKSRAKSNSSNEPSTTVEKELNGNEQTLNQPITNNHKPITNNQKNNSERGATDLAGVGNLNPKKSRSLDEKFRMDLDWEPNPETWEGNCFRAGINPDYKNYLHEFRLYWQNRDDQLNENGWQGKLINNIKSNYQKTKIINTQADPEDKAPLSEEFYQKIEKLGL